MCVSATKMGFRRLPPTCPTTPPGDFKHAGPRVMPSLKMKSKSAIKDRFLSLGLKANTPTLKQIFRRLPPTCPTTPLGDFKSYNTPGQLQACRPPHVFSVFRIEKRKLPTEDGFGPLSLCLKANALTLLPELGLTQI